MKKIFPALLLFVLLMFACTPQQDDILYRIQTHLDELENRIARIEESLSSSNRDLSNLRSEVDAINLELSRTSKFIAEFKDMDFISTEDVERMSRRITDLELKYAQVSAVMNVSDIRELIYKLSDVESAQEVQEEKYQRFVETTERLLKEANIEEFASKFKELENAVTSMENQIDEASEMAVRVEALERSVENLSLQAPNSGNNSSSSKVIFELTRDVSELKNSLSDIKNVIREEIDRKIAALPADSPEALQQYVVNTTSLVKQLTVELETLRSVVREYDRNRFLRLDEGYVSYIVKSGDNLSTIARTYNLGLDGVRRIVGLNNISDPNKLLVGQMLKIPVDDPSELFCYPLGKPFSPEQIIGVFGE
ncbi:MAG: peptidoglycan-binding protein, partial [Thermotogae bacterium]